MSANGFFKLHRPWDEWACMLLGLLIGFSPWLVGQQQDQVATWIMVLIGALLFGLAQLEHVGQRWKDIRGESSKINGNNAANLLLRRMATLSLDPCELRRLHLPLMHHMQRQCQLCDNRQYCKHVLASASSGSALRDCDDWRDYCRNALALDLLSGLQSRSRGVYSTWKRGQR